MRKARRPTTALHRRLKRGEDAGRAAAASWVGHPHVVSVVSALRPDVRAMVDPFGFRTEVQVVTAAAVLTSVTGVYPDRSEWANPFLAWTPEQRQSAQPAVLGVRRLVAVLAQRLRSDGIDIDAVFDDADYDDRYGFLADHFYLLLLLWLDISLDGRSGAEIAAELPALPTASWNRNDPGMGISDHASERDVRDVFAFRRAWRAQRGLHQVRKPYAGGGKPNKARHEPTRDRRRRAVAKVRKAFPAVTAGQLRATWEGDKATPGGLLRTLLELQTWDRPPAAETLRTDLLALIR